MGKRRWCGGLVFEEVGVSYLGTPDTPFQKSRGEGQVLKKEGVRCTTIEGVACQEWLAKGVKSFQECLTKSVAPRVSL